ERGAGSWADAAIRRDRERRVSSEPTKVHGIRHVGKHYRVPAIHLCEPPPQRTPVLYQAGAASRGKQCAAEHAECVFVAAPSKGLLKKTVADIRRRTAEAGREPSKVLISNLQTVILGETDAKARAKFEAYKSWGSYEGAMALISGWSGFGLSQFKPDDTLRHCHSHATQSVVA
ncbi:LLM class flavin-dependent oxidoreductase, partial [Pseudomonas syringae]